MLDQFPGDPASQGPEAQVPGANPGARLRNLKLTLAYDGTDFSGWQVQPGRATIQGLVASAIGRLTGENVLPQGSGRTDAGVHALAQVATLATRSPIPVENFAKVLNDTLPASIRGVSAPYGAQSRGNVCARGQGDHGPSGLTADSGLARPLGRRGHSPGERAVLDKCGVLMADPSC